MGLAAVSGHPGSAHMSPMTLRTEIEALLVEFDHFAYRGAPLDVAVEKLQEILARTAPRVLTTVEELDSEESSKARFLVSNDGPDGFVLYHRTSSGENRWVGVGSDHIYTSAELIEELAMEGEPSFTPVHDPEVPEPRVLTTEEELNSEEAFEALCIMPWGGPLRVATSRSCGVNTWQEPGWDGELTSAELLAHFASIGAEPRFTVIKG